MLHFTLVSGSPIELIRDPQNVFSQAEQKVTEIVTGYKTNYNVSFFKPAPCLVKQLAMYGVEIYTCIRCIHKSPNVVDTNSVQTWVVGIQTKEDVEIDAESIDVSTEP